MAGPGAHVRTHIHTHALFVHYSRRDLQHTHELTALVWLSPHQLQRAPSTQDNIQQYSKL